jgi:hypothetical protein
VSAVRQAHASRLSRMTGRAPSSSILVALVRFMFILVGVRKYLITLLKVGPEPHLCTGPESGWKPL